MELRSCRSLSNPLLPVRTEVFYQERVYCGPCHHSDGQPHDPEWALDLVRHRASRDLPAVYPGDRPLREGALALRDTRVRVGVRRGDDRLFGLQHALPAHAQLRDEREDRQLLHRGRGGARDGGVLQGARFAPDLLRLLPRAPQERLDRVLRRDGWYRLRLRRRFRLRHRRGPALRSTVRPRDFHRTQDLRRLRPRVFHLAYGDWHRPHPLGPEQGSQGPPASAWPLWGDTTARDLQLYGHRVRARRLPHVVVRDPRLHRGHHRLARDRAARYPRRAPGRGPGRHDNLARIHHAPQLLPNDGPLPGPDLHGEVGHMVQGPQTERHRRGFGPRKTSNAPLG